MNADAIFGICNLVALLGWVLLVLAGRRFGVATVVCKFIIPGLFAVVYLGLIATHWGGHQGGFGSVAQVQQLFADPWLLTAGWVHYLAFDLFLGAWEVRDAQRVGMPHWWTLPSLVLTFLFGPIGFLLYLGLRAVRLRMSPGLPAKLDQRSNVV